MMKYIPYQVEAAAAAPAIIRRYLTGCRPRTCASKSTLVQGLARCRGESSPLTSATQQESDVGSVKPLVVPMEWMSEGFAEPAHIVEGLPPQCAHETHGSYFRDALIVRCEVQSELTVIDGLHKRKGMDGHLCSGPCCELFKDVT